MDLTDNERSELKHYRCTHDGPHPDSRKRQVGDQERCVDCGAVYQVYEAHGSRMSAAERISEYQPRECRACTHLEVVRRAVQV